MHGQLNVKFRLTYITTPKMNKYAGVFIFFHAFLKLQGDSVARGPKLLSINSLGPLATELLCTIAAYRHRC